MKIEELLKNLENFPYSEIELKSFILRLANGHPTEDDLDVLGDCVWDYPKLVKFAYRLKQIRRSDFMGIATLVELDNAIEELEKDDLR